jgi:hypothetical protein
MNGPHGVRGFRGDAIRLRRCSQSAVGGDILSSEFPLIRAIQTSAVVDPFKDVSHDHTRRCVAS